MNQKFPRIELAVSASEIQQCFLVMSQLRPRIPADDFVRLVQIQQENGYQLAYMSDPEVLGVAGFNLAENFAWGKYLYVADLIVDKNKRSCGYGEALFNWLLEYAQQHDCQQLHLDSGVQRYAAHRFYLQRRMNISSHHFSRKL